MKLYRMENENIAEQLMDLTLSRIEKIFQLIHDKDINLFCEIVRELSQKITHVCRDSIRQVGHKYQWRYADCKSDHSGWIDNRNYRPHPYDMTLVKIKTATDQSIKELPAWWTGKSWEGRKIKEVDAVKYWKLEPWGN